MPRIRTLKPQFWDSPSTANADLAVRLLFMAMWNWADDAGRGTANLKELEAFAFPHDDIADLPRRSSGNSAAGWRNFAELLLETASAYEVTLYTVHGRRFYEISSFRVHQSKYFNPNSSLPGPGDGEIWDLASEYGFQSSHSGRTVAEIPPHSSGNSAVSRGDLPLDRDRDRDRDRDKTLSSEPCEPKPTPSAARYPQAFEDWWHHYPRKDSKRTALTAWQRALKRGATTSELIGAAENYAADPNRRPEYTKQPATWLNGDCWLSEPLPTRNGQLVRTEQKALDWLARGQQQPANQPQELPQ